MPGTTPNQGYSYPLSTDRPCDLPASLSLLASSLDTKAQGYDTDAARLVKRKWVKISRTSFAFNSQNTTEIQFDTVENNNGTPTDLTVDPFSVKLNAGCWMLLGKIIIPTNAFGNTYYGSMSSNNIPTFGSFSVAQTSRDFNGLLGITTLTYGSMSYLTSTGTVNLFLTPSPTSLTINYASLAAWWISDP